MDTPGTERDSLLGQEENARQGTALLPAMPDAGGGPAPGHRPVPAADPRRACRQ